MILSCKNSKKQSIKDTIIDDISNIDIVKEIILDKNDDQAINFIQDQNIHIDKIIDSKSKKELKSRKSKPNIYDAIDYKELLIHSHIQANQGRSFEIHVMMIYDIEQQSMMRSMSVADYKKNFKTILRENPSSINIYKIEAMPGKSYAKMFIPIKTGPALVDCIIFCLIMDKDVPSTDDKELIVSSNILRKVIVGNEKKINLVINRVGAFLKKSQ